MFQLLIPIIAGKWDGSNNWQSSIDGRTVAFTKAQNRMAKLCKEKQTHDQGKGCVSTPATPQFIMLPRPAGCPLGKIPKITISSNLGMIPYFEGTSIAWSPTKSQLSINGLLDTCTGKPHHSREKTWFPVRMFPRKPSHWCMVQLPRIREYHTNITNFPRCFQAFPRIFQKIPRNFPRFSPDFLVKFHHFCSLSSPQAWVAASCIVMDKSTTACLQYSCTSGDEKAMGDSWIGFSGMICLSSYRYTYTYIYILFIYITIRSIYIDL